MDFLSRTINFGYRLTDLEDELILYILKNKSEVSQIKIVDLANIFYTVPNTITRLCHKLSYSGFSELKNELKHELRYELNQEVFIPDSQREILMRNFELIDPLREEKVIRVLKNAPKVNFYSIGQTAYATRIFVDNFYAIDYKFFFYHYANELRHRIENALSEVFFFVSLSGEKSQILELAEYAKEKDNVVISLTGLSSNSLSKIADIRLYCYSPEEMINNYNITDKTPLLIIMNSLFHNYIKSDV